MPANSTSSTKAPRVPRAGLVLLNRSAIRCTAVVASLLMTALVGAPGATAFWRSVGLGSASAATGSLAAPTGVSAPSVNVGAVPVSWTASAGPITAGYYVTRITGSTTAPACGSSPAALLATTSRTDNAAPLGTHTYVVTAVYRSWTAVSSASGSVTVALPASNQLAFTQAPSNATAGTAISLAVRVALQTNLGLPVLTPGVEITLSLGTNPASGTLSGAVKVFTDALGVATFTNLSINKAGSGYKLAASSPGLTPSSGSFNITAAAAKTLQINTAPVSGAASASANLGPISVQRLDAFGNLVTSGDLAVGLSSTPRRYRHLCRNSWRTGSHHRHHPQRVISCVLPLRGHQSRGSDSHSRQYRPDVGIPSSNHQRQHHHEARFAQRSCDGSSV
ncbi:UNVERIFIED_ORG: hypothetical protein J2X79_001944 [Arthrobacter globiformis]|nr:hypothetical protein [Arthrobacter globiformis]